MKKDQEKINSKRIDVKFEIGAKILYRSMNPGKIGDKYEGPFEILDVDEKRNRLYIDMEEKEKWVNIKQIKPFVEEGEDVVVSAVVSEKRENE